MKRLLIAVAFLFTSMTFSTNDHDSSGGKRPIAPNETAKQRLLYHISNACRFPEDGEREVISPELMKDLNDALGSAQNSQHK